MAHDLYIENGEAHMMYVGDLPWHGLGTKLKQPATSAEAIRAAGLDWKVLTVPLYATDGKNGIAIPRHFGIVPEPRWGKRDCPVFGVVGKDYRILQNAEAFEFFDSIVGEKVAMYHTAGALGEGERVWILAKLDGVMEVTGNDQLEKFVLLSTGHDGRSSVRVVLTPVRVVCQNTLTLAMATGEEIARAYHSPSLARQLDTARRKVQALIKGFNTLQDSFRAMARTKMDNESVTEYYESVFPLPPRASSQDDSRSSEARQRAEALRRGILADRRHCAHLFRAGRGNDDHASKETLWAAYNGVTEYMDHWRVKAIGSQRMSSLCFGSGYQVKNRAYQAALKRIGNPALN